MDNEDDMTIDTNPIVDAFTTVRRNKKSHATATRGSPLLVGHSGRRPDLRRLHPGPGTAVQPRHGVITDMGSEHCIFAFDCTARPRATSACAPRWRERLPADWREKTLVPTSFRVYREHEIPARQIFGQDALGATCFYAYDYRAIEPRSDDDEEFYPALVYGESLKAWRLLDGQWLVYRRREVPESDAELAETLAVEPRMPR